MPNSTRSRHSATLGIQARVPAVPVAQRRVTQVDQLPEYLKHILEIYPPALSTAKAAALNGGGVSKLYKDKDEGHICAIKDGGSTRWLTWSIVFRLANLPEVPTKLPPSPVKEVPFGSPEACMAMNMHFAAVADRPITPDIAEAPPRRRGRGRSRKQPSPPNIASPPTQPAEHLSPSASE